MFFNVDYRINRHLCYFFFFDYVDFVKSCTTNYWCIACVIYYPIAIIVIHIYNSFCY